MRYITKFTPLLPIVAALFFTNACQAGRPLTVDDANVNAVGAGQVEVWYVRKADGAGVWNVAPA